MDAKKRFGQNFLHDQVVLQQIINCISPQADDHVVEIGPGKAALTDLVVPLVSRLDLIEIDRDLVALLEKKSFPDSVHLHSADALKFDFTKLADANDKYKMRVIGNLPYNISTPLLFHLFEQPQLFKDMHFMLQREVVVRMCANPGDSNFGRLSLMAQYYCDAQLLMQVPPEAFTPQPKVMSAIVRLTPREKPPYKVDDWGLFSKIVREAFSHRRKTIRNALKIYMSPPLIDLLVENGLDLKLRPQQLSGEDYALIARCLASCAS